MGAAIAEMDAEDFIPEPEPNPNVKTAPHGEFLIACITTFAGHDYWCQFHSQFIPAPIPYEKNPDGSTRGGGVQHWPFVQPNCYHCYRPLQGHMVEPYVWGQDNGLDGALRGIAKQAEYEDKQRAERAREEALATGKATAGKVTEFHPNAGEMQGITALRQGPMQEHGSRQICSNCGKEYTVGISHMCYPQDVRKVQAEKATETKL